VKPEQLAISMSTYQLEEGLVLYGIATIKDQKPVINILGYKVDCQVHLSEESQHYRIGLKNNS
jgi:hypothetical protein